jgi:hypothetical protein
MIKFGHNIRGIVAVISGTYIHEGSFLRKHDHQQCDRKALMLVMFNDGNFDMTFVLDALGLELQYLYEAQPQWLRHLH